VGKSTEFGPQVLSMQKNTDRPVLVGGTILDKFDAAVNEQMLGADQTHSFVKAMNKIAKEKGETFKS